MAGRVIESISHGPFTEPVNADGEWIITRDLLAEEFGDEPETNTRSVGYDALKEEAEATGRTFRWLNSLHAFRLYDDDGVLYYEGTCTTNESFGPLDWAMANAGAVRIDYRQADGSWETL